MQEANPDLAKLTQPVPTRIILRHSVFKKLEKGREVPATWVSGPAGSGKTTVISSFIETNKIPCLWYHIDEGDSDIASFFYYLGRAAAKAAPGFKPLPLYTPEYTFGTVVFARRFFEELFSRLAASSIVVFDDYHEIAAESQLHDVFRHALEVIPVNVHVIILSRTNPGKSFTKARTNKILSLLSWEDLQLTLPESKELVHCLGMPGLNEEITAELHQKSAGWMAGLILLLNYFQPGHSLEEVLPEYTPEDIFDYFASELFATLDPAMQDFLLTLSVFPGMTAEMAQELTGSKQADQHLLRLHQDNYFTERRPGKNSPFYQFHPLFREFLLHQAINTFSRSHYESICERAASILESRDYPVESLTLLFNSHNYEKIVPVLLNLAPTLVGQGRLQSLQAFLARLPEEICGVNGWLLAWQGVCLLPYNQKESREVFEKSLALFEQQGGRDGILFALCGIADSVIFSFDEFTQFDPLIPRFEAILNDYPHFPDPNMEARFICSAYGAFNTRRPDHPLLTMLEEKAQALQSEPIQTDLKAQLLLDLIFSAAFSGNLTKAEYFLNIYRGLTTAPDISPLALTTLHGLKVFCGQLQGDFERCRKSMRAGLDLASNTGVYNMNMLTIGNAIAAALGEGDTKTAAGLIKEMELLLAFAGTWQKDYYHVLCMWKGLLDNDMALIKLHAAQSRDTMFKSGMPQTTAVNLLGVGINHWLMGQKDEAHACITESLRLCRDFLAPQVAFGCHLTLAYWHRQEGKENEMIEQLTQAFVLARQHGYITTWYWHGEIMAILCAEALERNIETGYVTHLIKERKLNPPNSLWHQDRWPWPVKIYTLAPFELVLDDKPFRPRKAPERALALLKALLALGGRQVPEMHLAEVLWPDKDGDMQYQTLKTTLHRLRTLLVVKDAIKHADRMITLDPNQCWVDAWTFERLADEAARLQKLGKIEEAMEKYARTCRYYQGEFLAGEDNPHALAVRQRLKQKFLGSVIKFGRHLEEENGISKAVALYEKALRQTPAEEKLYQRLMDCHLQEDRRSEAAEVYKRCHQMLSTGLGVAPSPATISLYKKVRLN